MTGMQFVSDFSLTLSLSVFPLMCRLNQTGVCLILHNYFSAPWERGWQCRHERCRGHVCDSDHNPIFYPPLHTLRIERDAFLYRPKQRKSRVHLQNWLFFCHYIPIVSTAKPWPLGLLSDCYKTQDSSGREGWKRQDGGRSREGGGNSSHSLWKCGSYPIPELYRV